MECAHVSLLEVNQNGFGRDELVVKERSSLQRELRAIRSYSTAEISETLIVFRNDVVEQVLRAFQGNDLNWKDRNCLEGTITYLFGPFA